MEGSESNTRKITREEYINSLTQWLDNARILSDYYSRNYMLCSGLSLRNQFSTPPRFNRQDNLRANGNPIFLPGIYEFVIPPMWKRFVAEILDFSILFMIKLFLTFAAVETFNFVTVENYGFDTIEKYLQNPKMAMQLSIELLSLEILHRCVVCCYEVYWLKGGPCATPGKRYMGLIVIQVDNISPGLVENRVRVNPCTNLGIQHALIRAILKNLFIGFMLPICFTMYLFRYNRTGYDVISKSIVVEYNPNMQPVD